MGCWMTFSKMVEQVAMNKMVYHPPVTPQQNPFEHQFLLDLSAMPGRPVPLSPPPHQTCRVPTRIPSIDGTPMTQPTATVVDIGSDWLCGCGKGNECDFVYCRLCGKPRHPPKWSCLLCGFARNKTGRTFLWGMWDAKQANSKFERTIAKAA